MKRLIIILLAGFVVSCGGTDSPGNTDTSSPSSTDSSTPTADAPTSDPDAAAPTETPPADETPPSSPTGEETASTPDPVTTSDAVYSIFAEDGAFLGVINFNSFDSDSICDSFGNYGSRFSSTSIWNSFGSYGSDFSSKSAYNEFTSTPPVIYENDVPYSYLTKNTFKTPWIDPDDLMRELNANGCGVSR